MTEKKPILPPIDVDPKQIAKALFGIGAKKSRDENEK